MTDPRSASAAAVKPRLLSAHIPAVEAEIARAIGTGEGRDERLAEAMRHAALGGGKRFRGLLVIGASALGHASHGEALRVAAAIECVHAQSLVHDDLPCMDDDDVRRGRPSLHRLYDEATAVLAGDALLALAFEILAHPATHADASVRAELVLGLARAIGQDGLAGGQMMDLYPPATADAEHVRLCQTRKTGKLISFAVESGAVIGGLAPAQRGRLANYAADLGLLFQVRDDLLDETGDPRLAGKQLRKDAALGRTTSVSLLGAEGASGRLRQLYMACESALADFGPEARWLRALVRFALMRRR